MFGCEESISAESEISAPAATVWAQIAKPCGVKRWYPFVNKEKMTEVNKKYLMTAEDGITRCWWGHEPFDYRKYHDEEWGRPVADDFRLFEKICLEGFQSGLSWLTILRKRENFREAFAGFDFNKIAEFDDEDIACLLQNAAIIRHRGKIEATINNARRALEIVYEFGSLASYIWGWDRFCILNHSNGPHHDNRHVVVLQRSCLMFVCCLD